MVATGSRPVRAFQAHHRDGVEGSRGEGRGDAGSVPVPERQQLAGEDGEDAEKADRGDRGQDVPALKQLAEAEALKRPSASAR